jgi:hypothetical protein
LKLRLWNHSFQKNVFKLITVKLSQRVVCHPIVTSANYSDISWYSPVSTHQLPENTTGDSRYTRGSRSCGLPCILKTSKTGNV